MCGFVGIVKLDGKPVIETELRTMMNKIKHRGPNDSGIFVDDNLGLGFLRLSILDLSPRGHQPMVTSDNRYVIVHNGEVYNYIELRKELIDLGYQFYSDTDTEVIINSYLAWGEECLHKFNGMWSFCIYDKVKKSIFCSRDRYGIKPFYYYCDNNILVFGSEIPAILAVLPNKLLPNLQVVAEFLASNRTDYNEETFFLGVNRLKHGHNLITILDGKSLEVRVKKWYDLQTQSQRSTPFANPQQFHDNFSSSIELRLRSDVPVGTCLSGGLDSSSILAVLKNELSRNDIHTFSAVYGNDFKGDETKFISLFKGSTPNMHFTHPSAENLEESILDLIEYHAEPFPTTAIYAQYKVMELAAKSVTVSLDGQGADEHLAGYHYFYGYLFKELSSGFKVSRLLNELYADWKLNKSFLGLKSWVYFSIPFLRQEFSSSGFPKYFTGELKRVHRDGKRDIDTLFSSKTLNESLQNHFEYKLEHLLKWADRNSMRFSIEARLPFLDYRLVERSLATSSENKIYNGWTKVILRESMKGNLPEEIRLRKDKIGFSTPQKMWLQNTNIKKRFIEAIQDPNPKLSRLIDWKKLNYDSQDYTGFLQQNDDVVWKTIILDAWLNQFFD
jgi:asparagine synthase (glutamine-hydrolysing)